MNRRAVISGIGVVAPNGVGTQTYWDALCKGVSGIRRIDRFDPAKYATSLAGTIVDFDPTAFVERRLVVQTDYWTWLAFAAAEMALTDAGLVPGSEDAYSMAVVTAASSGGNEFGQREIQRLWFNGPRHVGAYQSIAWFYAASTGQLSIKHGMKGPCGVLAAEQAGGLDAIAQARRLLVRDDVAVVLVGGTEAPISPYALLCQLDNGFLSGSPDPEAAFRPFGAEANGYVPGEGGAILILEELQAARDRGVSRFYAEVVGHASTQDAYHPTRLAPDGRQYGRAMSLAMADAGIEPEEVDAVFADGFGTLEADEAEVRAIHHAFGPHSANLAVTAPKSMTGRLYAGGSSLDVAGAALALRDDFLPPTINTGELADACDLDIVTEGRPGPLKTIVVGARGVGGFNSALVLRKFVD